VKISVIYVYLVLQEDFARNKTSNEKVVIKCLESVAIEVEVHNFQLFLRIKKLVSSSRPLLQKVAGIIKNAADE